MLKHFSHKLTTLQNSRNLQASTYGGWNCKNLRNGLQSWDVWTQDIGKQILQQYSSTVSDFMLWSHILPEVTEGSMEQLYTEWLKYSRIYGERFVNIFIIQIVLPPVGTVADWYANQISILLCPSNSALLKFQIFIGDSNPYYKKFHIIIHISTTLYVCEEGTKWGIGQRICALSHTLLYMYVLK
jgi:hypothetical protein